MLKKSLLVENRNLTMPVPSWLLDTMKLLAVFFK